jgi:hypothetical protein
MYTRVFRLPEGYGRLERRWPISATFDPTPPWSGIAAKPRQAARRRQRGLLLGAPLLGLLVGTVFSVSPPGALLIGAVSVMLGFFLLLPGSSSVDPGELAGVEGEHATLERLRALPDGYRVINRVQLPGPAAAERRTRTGFSCRRTDRPVDRRSQEHSRTGAGRARRAALAAGRRSGCSSCPSWNAMDNPEFQVRDQVDALRHFLLVNGHCRRTSKAMICLAHPEVAIRDPDTLAFPVRVPDQLVAQISDSAPRRSVQAAWTRSSSRLRNGHSLHSTERIELDCREGLLTAKFDRRGQSTCRTGPRRCILRRRSRPKPRRSPRAGPSGSRRDRSPHLRCRRNWNWMGIRRTG